MRLCTVINFLAEQASRGNKAAYRCALKAPLRLHYKLEIDNPTYVAFIKGLFHISPPCRGAPMLAWDLSYFR